MSVSIGPHLRPFRIPGETEGPLDESALRPAAKDPFEIEDFTAISDWEKFSASLESILRDWGFPRSKDELSNMSKLSPKSWKQEKKSVSFHDCSFWVTRHTQQFEQDDSKLDSNEEIHTYESDVTDDSKSASVLDEMMDGKNDFPCGAHPLFYFYGFHDFIVMTPQGKEQVDNRTRVKMTLGTITATLNTVGCDIPFFVQVMNRSRAMYHGVFSDSTYRTSFEMVVLPKRACHNLSDLVDVFRNKVYIPFPMVFPSCSVTARRSYLLEDWTSHVWSQQPPDLDIFGSTLYSEEGFIPDMKKLPFGSLCDPVKKLTLHTTWVNLSEEMTMETEVHNPFDPLDAPQWSVSVVFEDALQGLLGEYLNKMLELTQNHGTMRQILGSFLDASDDNSDSDKLEQVPNALSKLTGPSFGITDIIKAGQETSSTSECRGPIDPDYLKKMLEFLFPDSISESPFPYPKDFNALPWHSKDAVENFRIPISTLKSIPMDGLVWRLIILLCHCRYVFGGSSKQVAHLLHEFFLEIRYRYQNGLLIPGLPSGSPDHSTTLLHQKLQMVNCCIEKKIAREKSGMSVEEKEESAGNNESEEEFFDCEDETAALKSEKESSTQDIPVWSLNPEGRLRKFGRNQKLLEHPELDLWIPVCQDPAPLTEDTLAEQAEIMLQLGTSDSGSEIRTRMQSASLLSDMESFKSANPGAVLGDFVRWYSPRDWIEDDQNSKGKLSPRMEISGNPWIESWNDAKPVPARRQKRLFDDTKEAGSVLSFLTGLKPGEVVDMLMPSLLHVTVCRIIDETMSAIPHVNEILMETISLISQISKLPCKSEVQHYSALESHDFAKRGSLLTEVIQKLQTCELKLAQALSLRSKFLSDADEVKLRSFPSEDHDQVDGHMEQFVLDLTQRNEVKVIGARRGPAGQLIQNMFQEAKKVKEMMVSDVEGGQIRDIFPDPCSREYILRTYCSRPYPYSRPCPQKIYCCIKDNDFRLAGAFTNHKIYL